MRERPFFFDARLRHSSRGPPYIISANGRMLIHNVRSRSKSDIATSQGDVCFYADEHLPGLLWSWVVVTDDGDFVFETHINHDWKRWALDEDYGHAPSVLSEASFVITMSAWPQQTQQHFLYLWQYARLTILP
jgi:hypothetical protein